jgi:hypothetical protein
VNGEVEREKFMEIVETIRSKFPSLRTKLIAQPSQVDAMLEIPAQTGLAFPVSINLQGDELHLNVGIFWCEWFPCQKQEVCDRFVDAVCGLLSGAYRVVEYWRFGSALKAHLQKPDGDGWKRVSWHAKLHVPVSWGMKTKILQNVPRA